MGAVICNVCSENKGSPCSPLHECGLLIAPMRFRVDRMIPVRTGPGNHTHKWMSMQWFTDHQAALNFCYSTNHPAGEVYGEDYRIVPYRMPMITSGTKMQVDG